MEDDSSVREPLRTDERPTGMLRLRTATAALAALAVAAALAGLTACGDDHVDRSSPTTSSPAAQPAPTVLLRSAISGGCEVLGHNCPTYIVWSDGRVDLGRTGVDGPPELTGHIPASEVTAWWNSVATLDPVALAAQVGPGTCNSCVDGGDILVTIERPGSPIVLDSTKLAFDPTNAVFAGLERMMTDVRAVGSLTIVTVG